MITNKERIATLLHVSIEIVDGVLDCPITTVEQAMNEYHKAPSGSGAELYTMLRWKELSIIAIQIAPTPELVIKSYRDAPSGNADIMRVAIRRLAELLPD